MRDASTAQVCQCRQPTRLIALPLPWVRCPRSSAISPARLPRAAQCRAARRPTPAPPARGVPHTDSAAARMPAQATSTAPPQLAWLRLHGDTSPGLDYRHYAIVTWALLDKGQSVAQRSQVRVTHRVRPGAPPAHLPAARRLLRRPSVRPSARPPAHSPAARHLLRRPRIRLLPPSAATARQPRVRYSNGARRDTWPRTWTGSWSWSDVPVSAYTGTSSSGRGG
jgi:hypothetical protein